MIRAACYLFLLGLLAPDTSYMHVRGGLDRVTRKLRDHQPVTVAFLGGSLTYNPGWRDKVCTYLRERWPREHFRFIAAGIPSLGSVPHAFRLQRDVLDSGRVDLLFVETAVNDRVNGTDSTDQVRALEGIVRRALPSADIVMMAFADPDKTPVEIGNQEKIAEHYHLPSLDIAQEVHDRIQKGEFSWEKDFKDIHPAEFGQELYFESIRALLEACWKRQPGQRAPMAAPIDPDNFSRGTYVDVAEAGHDPRWTLDTAWTPKDSAGTRPGFVHVPVLEADTPGAGLTLAFTGTAVGIAVVSGPDAGTITYAVDQWPPRTMNLNTKWSAHLHLPWYEVLEGGLEPGPHVLHLSVGAGAVRIVHFLVNGPPARHYLHRKH